MMTISKLKGKRSQNKIKTNKIII